MTINTKIFLGVLFSLAAVGLFVIVQTNPLMLFISIAIFIGIAFFLHRFNPIGPKQDSGYQKALRSQKKKGKLTSSELQKLTKLKKSTRDIPFKVIEGNKKGKSPKDKQSHTNFH